METIKRLSEYTNEDFLSITEEQLGEIVNVECMYEGVATEYMKPEPLKIPAMPLRDAVVYDFQFSLSDETEAKELELYINNLKSRCKLDYNYGSYDTKYIKPLQVADAYCASRTLAFTKDKYDSIAPVIATIKSMQGSYDDAIGDYEEKHGRYDEIKESVYTRYYSAIREMSNLDSAIRTYKEYLRLSNGSSDIAENFFKKSQYAHMYDKVIARLKEESSNEI